jgi:hypothetical protein
LSHETAIAALKWAIEHAERLEQAAALTATRSTLKTHIDALRYQLFKVLTAQPALTDGLVITPEMAHAWLTGQDKHMEQRLRELAHAHEERLADNRPPCQLCSGLGRIDDFVCFRCDGSGKEPAGEKEAAR